MQVTPQWQGLRSEIEYAAAAWRELPDNALWLLCTRQTTALRARNGLKERIQAGVIVAVILAVYVATCTIMYSIDPHMESKHYFEVLVYAFIAPSTILYLLFVLGRVALQAQQWLSVERTDAKRVTQAMLDPLLCLTSIGARDVLAAALRELLPLAWRATAIACGIVGLVTLTATFESDRFGMVLLLLPLTIGGYLMAGVLGGTALILLLFCLGLNSTSQAQRSFPAMLLLFHQIGALSTGVASFAANDALNSQPGLDPIAAVLGSLLLIGSVWLGAQLALHVGRFGMTWLLLTPVLLTFSFWILLGFVQVVAGLNSYSDDGVGFLNATALHLAGAWAGLTLFHSGAFITTLGFGQGYDLDDMGLRLFYHYPVIILTQLGLIYVLYRTAVEAAHQRLRFHE